MLKVFLSGGIGNRLFQLSFARFLRDQLGYSVGVVQLENSSKPKSLDVESVLSDFFNPRSKVALGRLSDSLINPWHTFRPNFLWGKRYDFRHSTRVLSSDLAELSSSGHVVGYFQDYDLLRYSLHSLVVELSEFLARKCGTIEKKPYEVVHVRGLDYREKKNLQNIGVLSDKYYESLLRGKSNTLRFCLTDDLKFAQSKLRHCNIDYFFDPQELNSIEALNFMQNAVKVICANSTFSYWGGLLAFTKGQADIRIPMPFFRSNRLNYGRGLLNPNFSSEPSIWVP